MTTMILLGVVFLAVVVPQALSARAERKREFLASIQFNAGSVPERNAGSVPERRFGAAAVSDGPEPQPRPARRPRTAAARRKTIFTLLLVSVAVTAIPAVLTPSKVTLVAQLAVDDCFLAYVGLLVRWRDARTPAPAPTPAGLVLTPSGVRPALRIG